MTGSETGDLHDDEAAYRFFKVLEWSGVRKDRDDFVRAEWAKTPDENSVGPCNVDCNCDHTFYGKNHFRELAKAITRAQPQADGDDFISPQGKNPRKFYATPSETECDQVQADGEAVENMRCARCGSSGDVFVLCSGCHEPLVRPTPSETECDQVQAIAGQIDPFSAWKIVGYDRSEKMIWVVRPDQLLTRQPEPSVCDQTVRDSGASE